MSIHPTFRACLLIEHLHFERSNIEIPVVVACIKCRIARRRGWIEGRSMLECNA
jgi:hypothetical protein